MPVEWLRTGEYAARAGISDSAVGNKVRRGELTRREDGRVPWDQGAADDEEAVQTGLQAAREEGQRLKNERMQFDMDVAKRKYVLRSIVDRNFFSWARAERDFWMAWPDRVAALGAAELGVDAGRLHAFLMTQVRANLAELAEMVVPIEQENED